ncbi:MAG: Glycosyl transferase group 1 [Candidatus Woesebacteria bacterium GW2011_GWA1_37_7]|uniref:Glycosyl transferase group 1 n=1 Tax=Candidatus Woesebacteria bacterium GW2011_GWA1_37_7 TaxID=1618545 RepID=A0A0G0JHF8_9BACT|nr:MAG: Glycosyl transferase group 1 [Candidatus Woesebacteria bacterium GW2011_GWA1_37_7]
MRIAIDISQIVYGTGVSTYTENLVKSLLKLDAEDEYSLFAGAFRRRDDILKIFPGTKVFPISPLMADIIWNKLHTLPIEKLIGNVDVFHSSDWAEPPSSAFKVTTVHDLYALKYPKMVHPKVLEVHKRKLSWVLRESRRIIVPSNSTKGDLTDLGVNENIIRVIPEAPSFSKASEAEVTSAKKKYRIQGDYLISIGVTELKNTKRIIEAFHLSTAGKELKMVLVGRPAKTEIKPERNIRILGHVPQDELRALLTGARGLVFASLYEGYGIPILDAFACGTPVVTSDTSSMPEVAGKAAVLVDPYDAASIADGITKILNGPKGFIEKGFARVGEFSWEKTAKMTLDVYKEAGK